MIRGIKDKHLLIAVLVLVAIIVLFSFIQNPNNLDSSSLQKESSDFLDLSSEELGLGPFSDGNDDPFPGCEDNEFLQKILQDLRFYGCQIPDIRILSEEDCGDYEGSLFCCKTGEITICENELSCSVLAHELSHALDFCKEGYECLDWPIPGTNYNCGGVADCPTAFCTEARAYAKSGQCCLGPGLDIGCVRDGVRASVCGDNTQSCCDSYTDEEINDMIDACIPDDVCLIPPPEFDIPDEYTH